MKHRHRGTQPHSQRMYLHNAIIHNTEWQHKTKIFEELLFTRLFKKKFSLSSYYLQTFWPKALFPGFIGPGVREQSKPWEMHACSTGLQWNVLKRRGLSPFTLSPSSFPHPKLDPQEAYSQKKDGKIRMLRKAKEFLTSKFPGDVPSYTYFQKQLNLPGLTMPTDLRIRHPPEIRPHHTSKFHCYL